MNFNIYNINFKQIVSFIFFRDYGPYCPVSLKKDNWLIYGKEANTVNVNQRKHKFFSDDEMNYFKEHVSDFVTQNYKKIQIPPPRIMLIGVRGSGLNT